MRWDVLDVDLDVAACVGGNAVKGLILLTVAALNKVVVQQRDVKFALSDAVWDLGNIKDESFVSFGRADGFRNGDRHDEICLLR